MTSRKEVAFRRFKRTIPEHATGDTYSMLQWAQQFLTNLEGSGHQLWLSWGKDGVSFGFAKPEWPGDHYGSPMKDTEDAIALSVYEYIQGEARSNPQFDRITIGDQNAYSETDHRQNPQQSY